MSRLKDLRKERGLTQIQMQMLTGIDQSDYSKIENGKSNTKNIRKSTLKCLCDALDIK